MRADTREQPVGLCYECRWMREMDGSDRGSVPSIFAGDLPHDPAFPKYSASASVTVLWTLLNRNLRQTRVNPRRLVSGNNSATRLFLPSPTRPRGQRFESSRPDPKLPESLRRRVLIVVKRYSARWLCVLPSSNLNKLLLYA